MGAKSSCVWARSRNRAVSIVGAARCVFMRGSGLLLAAELQRAEALVELRDAAALVKLARAAGHQRAAAGYVDRQDLRVVQVQAARGGVVAQAAGEREVATADIASAERTDAAVEVQPQAVIARRNAQARSGPRDTRPA